VSPAVVCLASAFIPPNGCARRRVFRADRPVDWQDDDASMREIGDKRDARQRQVETWAGSASMPRSSDTR